MKFLKYIYANLAALVFRTSDFAIDRSVKRFKAIDEALGKTIKANEDVAKYERQFRADSYQRELEAVDRIGRAARIQGRVRALID